MRSTVEHARHLLPAYDYILIGSGAAGATLAAEIQRRELGSVLLVEAGREARSPRLRIPSSYPLAFGSQWDWNHQTSPQPAMARRRLPLPAGKCVGGSTSMNAMIYIEPNAEEFVSWQAVAGDAWAPAKIAEDFEALRSTMKLAQQPAFTQLPHHPTHLEHNNAVPSRPELHPAMLRLLDCASANGWMATPYRDGFDHPAAGIAPYQRMQREGRRVSAMDLWFPRTDHHPCAALGPVTLLPGTSVRRILIQHQRAVGVELEYASAAVSVQSRRGVVVAAGTLGTPQLLLRSGIGPHDWLNALGIPCQHEAAELGSNLQDHLVVPIVMARSIGSPFQSPFDAAERIRYIQTRTGPRASNIAELGGFFDSKSLLSAWRTRSHQLDFQWHITPTHYLAYPHVPSERPALSFGLTAMRPASRGRMSPGLDRPPSDPSSPISWVIDPAYMTAPHETEDWMRALTWTREFLSHPAWENMLPCEQLPGSHRHSSTAIESYLRRMATTLYHYSSTCAMGTRSTSTVDPHFRVRGVESLWVCDASVMPQLTCCNPQATIMMMATKLARTLQ